jgi:hypothetical protein
MFEAIKNLPKLRIPTADNRLSSGWNKMADTIELEYCRLFFACSDWSIPSRVLTFVSIYGKASQFRICFHIFHHNFSINENFQNLVHSFLISVCDNVSFQQIKIERPQPVTPPARGRYRERSMIIVSLAIKAPLSIF